MVHGVRERREGTRVGKGIFRFYIPRVASGLLLGSLFWGPMELRGLDLESAPNPKFFGYPNPQIRGRKSEPEPKTRKPEHRGYPPRTRSAAILT